MGKHLIKIMGIVKINEYMRKQKLTLEIKHSALAGIAQLVGHHLGHQKVFYSTRAHARGCGLNPR